MRRAVLLLAIALLFSCAPAPPMEIASARALASCEAGGGERVEHLYRTSGPACLTSYPDGGRACSDSAQCAGLCIAGPSNRVASSVGPTSLVSGQCQYYHPTGSEECVQEVRSGRLASGCAAAKAPA